VKAAPSCRRSGNYCSRIHRATSGFYDNPQLGLPSSNGLMLLFEQKTGELRAVLLDEGHLTDIRTAVAGAIAARHLAPREVHRIGIAGTGIQARLQLEYLAGVTDCRDVIVTGRDEGRLARYRDDMAEFGFSVATTRDAAELAGTCNLIVTTTPATEPVLPWPGKVTAGLHITAVGSDTPHKQELDTAFLGHADVVVADSIAQCETRGEIHRALRDGAIRREDVVELGAVIAGKATGRESDEQLSVADLTGVAVQDIKIATAVFEAAAAT
jgi:ornithine cyclodeaminase